MECSSGCGCGWGVDPDIRRGRARGCQERSCSLDAVWISNGGESGQFYPQVGGKREEKYFQMDTVLALSLVLALSFLSLRINATRISRALYDHDCPRHRYYGGQVLEPSTQGFLSIIEKSFPRSDLYLFELLQNAVDDGASSVSFRVHSGGRGGGGGGGGLAFHHNGRAFTPLDVLGLASVGLSTKTGRTIGFMGVGFKAVYKRFSRVSISDAIWRFRFERPYVCRLPFAVRRSRACLCVRVCARACARVHFYRHHAPGRH